MNKFFNRSATGFMFVALTTTFFSCKKSDSSNPSNSCVNNGYIKFLQVGHKWVYNYEDLTSNDTMLNFEITSKTSADSYVFDLTGGGYFVSSTGPKRYMKECSDWLLINGTTDPQQPADRIYPLNRTANQTWTTNSGVGNYILVGKNVSVTTPAGTFVCDQFTYNQTGAFNTDTLWFSNDVGYIKYVGFLDDYELKSKNF